MNPQDYIIKFFKGMTDGVFVEINAGKVSYTNILEQQYRWVGVCTDKESFDESNRKCNFIKANVDGNQCVLSGILDGACISRMIHFLCINDTDKAEDIIKDFYQKEIFSFFDTRELYWVRRIIFMAIDSNSMTESLHSFLITDGEMTHINSLPTHDIYVHKIYDVLS